MSTKPQMSVVVLTYNRCNDLKRCLDSLRRQTFDDFELIVIDNGSSDDTPRLLERYEVKNLKDTTKCKGYLRNVGWRNTSAEIVAYLDDDAEPNSDWTSNIVGTFEQFRDAGAVGGPAIIRQENASVLEKARRSNLLGFLAKTYETVVLEGKPFGVGSLLESGALGAGGYLSFSARLKKPMRVDVLTTCNMAVKKSVLEQICGFDEAFVFNNEDVDLCIKIKKAGYKLVFNPALLVQHHVNPDAKTRASPYFLGRDFGYFYLKNVRPKSFDGNLRLLLNIFFFNMQFLYRALTTKNINYLSGGVSGFVSGIHQYLKTKSQTRL